MIRQTLRSCRRGSIAIEFAILAPVLIAVVFSIVAFGMVISINNALQQIVAEAARASVAGLSDTERDSLARAYITASAGAYPFIDPRKLAVSTSGLSGTAFRVSAQYDMSDSVAAGLMAALSLPAPSVSRSAVVQRGGF